MTAPANIASVFLLGFDPSAIYHDRMTSQYAYVAFGVTGATLTRTDVANLITPTGAIGADQAISGAVVRSMAAGAMYGRDKAIFAFGIWGHGGGGEVVKTFNLVTNVGAIGSDQTAASGVSARQCAAATGYGVDTAICSAWSSPTNVTNLVSNAGVIAADTYNSTAFSGGGSIGTSAAARYGDGLAMFANMHGSLCYEINRVGVNGVVADWEDIPTTPNVLPASATGACYGVGLAILGNGTGATNAIYRISYAGVISDTVEVASTFHDSSATNIDGQRAFFYGGTDWPDYGGVSQSTMVSTTGVLASSTYHAATYRNYGSAAGYGG